MSATVTIHIENKPHAADSRMNLLQACLSLGFNVPYFCWHPALGSVGACRQCAVKQFRDENDTRGKIVMSCMTPVTQGLRIAIEDPEVREFRRSVIEWLMTNHPHDCPVCDEGGHCHLQDMTVMTGHDYRRNRFPKRTYTNQYLGPFLNHEMNRCIQCYRCVRFYGDYAGGHDLNVFAAHNHVYFGRAEDGVLEIPFAGNLAEICPTGVFTDKTLGNHYTRKWDLQMAPSVCVHCGVGCNTTPGERYGTLRRMENRYNGEVNGYFLCDRGRYGYEFVNDAARPRHPLMRATAGATPQPVAQGTAHQRAGAILAKAQGVIGIGSPRASLESNYALRTLVGTEHFYAGVGEQESRLIGRAIEIMQCGPARSPSLREIAQADAVLILGEDLTNVAPMMAYAVRQAVRNQPMEMVRKLKIPEWLDSAARDAMQGAKGPCFIATPAATALDEVATRTWHAAPEEIARLGQAVAHALAPEAPAVNGLAFDDEMAGLVESIATALKSAVHPLVIAGPSLGSEAIVQAAAAVAWALCDAGRPASLAFTMPECNSMGLGLFGAPPLEEAFRAVHEGGADTVVILENDLYRRAPAAEVDAFLGRAAHVIALDCAASATTARAELMLPAASFAECEGSLVSCEGRAQRFYEVFVPRGEIKASWRWLAESFTAAGRGESLRHWTHFDVLTAELAEAFPVFAPVQQVAPPASFREQGMRLNRQPHRTSGRTAMHANVSVREPKPPDDLDSPLAFSMEGYQGPPPVPPPAPLIPFFWAPGWNSTMQALNKFQEEVNGPLRGGDPGRRLIEPHAGPHTAWPACAAAPFTAEPGALLLVPFFHVFGSEELSILSPAIASLAPAPYLALGPEDFSALGLTETEPLLVSAGEIRLTLPARLVPTLPRGVAGLPRGLAALKGPIPAGRASVEKAGSA